MSHNPGGWDEDNFKWYALAWLVAVVLVLLANWAGIIHLDGPPPPPAKPATYQPRPTGGAFSCPFFS